MPALNSASSLVPIDSGIDTHAYYLQGPTAAYGHLQAGPDAYQELPRVSETLVLDQFVYGVGLANQEKTSFRVFGDWLAPEGDFIETSETVFQSDQVSAEAVSRASHPVIEITDEQAEQLLRFRERRALGR